MESGSFQDFSEVLSSFSGASLRPGFFVWAEDATVRVQMKPEEFAVYARAPLIRVDGILVVVKLLEKDANGDAVFVCDLSHALVPGGLADRTHVLTDFDPETHTRVVNVELPTSLRIHLEETEAHAYCAAQTARFAWQVTVANRAAASTEIEVFTGTACVRSLGELARRFSRVLSLNGVRLSVACIPPTNDRLVFYCAPDDPIPTAGFGTLTLDTVPRSEYAAIMEYMHCSQDTEDVDTWALNTLLSAIEVAPGRMTDSCWGDNTWNAALTLDVRTRAPLQVICWRGDQPDTAGLLDCFPRDGNTVQGRKVCLYLALEPTRAMDLECIAAQGDTLTEVVVGLRLDSMGLASIKARGVHVRVLARDDWALNTREFPSADSTLSVLSLEEACRELSWLARRQLIYLNEGRVYTTALAIVTLDGVLQGLDALEGNPALVQFRDALLSNKQALVYGGGHWLQQCTERSPVALAGYPFDEAHLVVNPLPFCRMPGFQRQTIALKYEGASAQDLEPLVALGARNVLVLWDERHTHYWVSQGMMKELIVVTLPRFHGHEERLQPRFTMPESEHECTLMMVGFGEIGSSGATSTHYVVTAQQ